MFLTRTTRIKQNFRQIKGQVSSNFLISCSILCQDLTENLYDRKIISCLHPIEWGIFLLWMMMFALQSSLEQQYDMNKISVKSRGKVSSSFLISFSILCEDLTENLHDRKMISCLHPIEWGIFLLRIMMVAPHSSSEQQCELNRISVKTRGQDQVSSGFLISFHVHYSVKTSQNIFMAPI